MELARHVVRSRMFDARRVKDRGVGDESRQMGDDLLLFRLRFLRGCHLVEVVLRLRLRGAGY